MSESTIRREQLKGEARRRGYSIAPRYMLWKNAWYDVRSGKCMGHAFRLIQEHYWRGFFKK